MLAIDWPIISAKTEAVAAQTPPGVWLVVAPIELCPLSAGTSVRIIAASVV
jgi:hypothetical protein